MHPFLFQIGQFKLPTYGVISLCALAIAVLLVRRYARIEGLAPGPTAEAIVLTLAVGFFGARLFEAVINWDRYFGHPEGFKLLLHSTGVFFGGLITAIPFCIYWFRRIGLPVLQGLDILALTGCIAEGVGRWGCFFSGCCWGTPTDLPWAVTFPEAGRRLHPGLPDVPIHPTQIYFSLNSLAILGILLIVYRNKRFHGRIIALYVLLYATTRFFLEMVRGDAERGFAFGGRLSTSQLLGIVLAAGAAAAYAALSRRHRLSGEPDWRPAKIVAVLLLTLFVAAPASAADGGFPLRLIKLSGDPGAKDTRAHIAFSRELGFNAVWVEGFEAGVWTKAQAPDGPKLDKTFLRLADSCRKLGMELWVSINPVAETQGEFVFAFGDDERRLLAFIALLEGPAGVRHLALSFDGQPKELRELSDIFAYGRSAAPAHLDLARHVAAAQSPDVALWLRPAADSDDQWADASTAYGAEFQRGLSALPAGIGIVWAGPKERSPAITRADLESARARLAGRPLLLADGFPENDNGANDAMALLLGALRGREAGIRDVVAGYLVPSGTPLAGSRLSLLTIAEYLRDPESYDPGKAAARAVLKLAGSDRNAETALTTQQLEWGGFIDGRNYWPRDALNPELAAGRLHDPAFVESFTWTVERYPGRMAALKGLADREFRDDLLTMMRRRLAIARVIPLVVEYLARVRAMRGDAAEMLVRIDDERRAVRRDADARREQELFLDAAKIPAPASGR